MIYHVWSLFYREFQTKCYLVDEEAFLWYFFTRYNSSRSSRSQESNKLMLRRKKAVWRPKKTKESNLFWYRRNAIIFLFFVKHEKEKNITLPTLWKQNSIQFFFSFLIKNFLPTFLFRFEVRLFLGKYNLIFY